MGDGNVRLLDPGGIRGRHHEYKIGGIFQAPAGLACQADDIKPLVTGGRRSFEDIGRAAAGGEGDKYIPRTAQGFYLAAENGLVPVIVGQGREEGGVCRQGDGRQGPPFLLETADELGGDVLGVGGAAAVAG